MFQGVSTKEELEREFELLVLEPHRYASSRAAWRLSASLDRDDALRALLSSNPDNELVLHALHWSGPLVLDMLQSQVDANRLILSSPCVQLNETNRRL